MASLLGTLSGSGLVEVLARVPLASHNEVQACCQDFRAILRSSMFLQHRTVGGYGPEIYTARCSEAGIVRGALHLLTAFMEPLPGIENVCFERDGVHQGERFYHFVQLRVGGPQVPPSPFNRHLYLDRVDPIGASRRLRDAYWAVVRSVFDGSPIPLAARIFILGKKEEADQEDGNSSAMALAVVWTGSEGGVVKTAYDSSWPDCGISACGGVSKNDMQSALASLQQLAPGKRPSFTALLEAFEKSLNAMEEGAGWQEEWDYDESEWHREYHESGEESGEISDEEDVEPDDVQQSTFDAPARADATWHFGETTQCLSSQSASDACNVRSA